MLSLVVPETSETITLSSFKRAFIIEDFPAFGLHTIAILMAFAMMQNFKLTQESKMP